MALERHKRQCVGNENRIEASIRRPISELPPRFRSVFPYISFNHVQSLVYETIMDTNKPIVVSAPTGSGKTGVFELAIIKVIMEAESRPIDFGGSKIIYLAPTKALCNERRADWSTKFKNFNMECVELTSDFHGPTNFKSMKKSCILLATPEKWDSITRSWVGNRAFIQSIRLLLIDEIHLINDGSRGATLEAVVSRMKTIRSQVWPTDHDNLRFVAVSATVSNVQDIADWFAQGDSIAKVYKVDPNARPVKLRTIVLGFKTAENTNDFVFEGQLNHKLEPVIKEHSNNKPTLIFCATRKSAAAAATTLAKGGKFDISISSEKRQKYLKISPLFKDKTLQETSRFGVAFHHAGLCLNDRRLIESGFSDGHIMILCCTSTLALGVNLPAHLVIIKNTNYYDEGQFKPYSESALVQMIGRAGRPQFDTEATAVIMTKSSCRDEIERMLTGRLVVESMLHKYLTEHLNSEIVLGTITDDLIAKKWMDSTFLRVRLMNNPENYGLKRTSLTATKESTLLTWCKSGIQKLIQYRMARRNNQGQLESTEPGRAMARHYVCLDTMIKLTQLKGSESLFDLLMVICSSNEVTSDLQNRIEDKPALRALNNQEDESLKLRFPIVDAHTSREKKAATLVQAVLGNLNITENAINQESIRVMKNASRVMACLKDIALTANIIGYSLLKNVLILSQCFTAKLWEDSIYVSKQLEKIGNILSYNLASNGLTSFESLRRANPANIEAFCSRLPPFGAGIQRTCLGLPIYRLNMMFKCTPHQNDKISLMVEVHIENGQDMRNLQTLPKFHESTLIVGNIRDNKVLLKQQVTDVSILSRPDLTWCFGTDLDKLDLPGDLDDIEVMILSEMFVGLNAKLIVKYREPEEDSP